MRRSHEIGVKGVWFVNGFQIAQQPVDNSNQQALDLLPLQTEVRHKKVDSNNGKVDFHSNKAGISTGSHDCKYAIREVCALNVIRPHQGRSATHYRHNCLLKLLTHYDQDYAWSKISKLHLNPQLALTSIYPRCGRLNAKRTTQDSNGRDGCRALASPGTDGTEPARPSNIWRQVVHGASPRDENEMRVPQEAPSDLAPRRSFN
jgi:hypothetical protein